MEERPPPDPAKLATTLRDWHEGELLPGRAMADLKHAGFDLLLPVIAENRNELAGPAELWAGWERATAGPAEVLESLWQAGAVDILGDLARA